MNLVWYLVAKSANAGNIHWTSTIIASTAPVIIANSCWWKSPAIFTPCLIVNSLPVQHIPDRVIPSAPTSLANSCISGNSAAATIISDNVGSCPCSTIFTLFPANTFKLASVWTGFGVPNSISDIIVPIIDPAHPSAIEHLIAIIIRDSKSAQHPIWVECITVATSLSIALGSIPKLCHISCLTFGALFNNFDTPNGLPNSIKHTSATSWANSYISLPSGSTSINLANSTSFSGSLTW